MYIYVPRSKLGHVCYTTPSSPFHSSTSSFLFPPLFLSSHLPLLLSFLSPSCPCPFHFLLSSLLSSCLIPSLFSFHPYSSPLVPPLPSHFSSLFFSFLLFLSHPFWPLYRFCPAHPSSPFSLPFIPLQN